MAPLDTIPTQQKAWMVLRKGSPADVLALQSDVPIASLCRGEVLVKIIASGMNPVGYKLMQIAPTIPLMNPRPHISENDFCGIIVDANKTGFNVGDEVYGLIPSFNTKKQGSLCQYAVVPSSHIVTKPSGITSIEAAGLALAGITAWGGIVDIGKIRTGQHVFINGGSTSVGMLALQIAKAKGCRVTVTTSPKNFDLVRSLGADMVVNYRESPPHEYFAAHPPTPLFDVIYDAVYDGLDLYTHSEAYLAPKGLYISVGAGFTNVNELAAVASEMFKVLLRPGFAGGVKRRFQRYSLGSTGFGTVLEELNILIVSGQVKPVIDSVYEFEDALQAYEKLMTERVRGKLIIKAPV